MLRVFLLLLTSTSLITFTTPAKKTTHTFPVEGLWIGTYSIDQVPEQGALKYYLIIKPEGELITEGQGGDGRRYYATGVWALEGDTLRLNYATMDAYSNPIESKAVAVFHDTGELTAAKWFNVQKPFNTGVFSSMKRIN